VIGAASASVSPDWAWRSRPQANCLGVFVDLDADGLAVSELDDVHPVIVVRETVEECRRRFPPHDNGRSSQSADDPDVGDGEGESGMSR